jgi:hypothetical protein
VTIILHWCVPLCLLDSNGYSCCAIGLYTKKFLWYSCRIIYRIVYISLQLPLNCRFVQLYFDFSFLFYLHLCLCCTISAVLFICARRTFWLFYAMWCVELCRCLFLVLRLSGIFPCSLPFGFLLTHIVWLTFLSPVVFYVWLLSCCQRSVAECQSFPSFGMNIIPACVHADERYHNTCRKAYR